jgi:hypothetical protein
MIAYNTVPQDTGYGLTRGFRSVKVGPIEASDEGVDEEAGVITLITPHLSTARDARTKQRDKTSSRSKRKMKQQQRKGTTLPLAAQYRRFHGPTLTANQSHSSTTTSIHPWISKEPIEEEEEEEEEELGEPRRRRRSRRQRGTLLGPVFRIEPQRLKGRSSSILSCVSLFIKSRKFHCIKRVITRHSIIISA